jgi:hypothetical protein
MTILTNLTLLILITGCSSWAKRCDKFTGKQRMKCVKEVMHQEDEYERRFSPYSR